MSVEYKFIVHYWYLVICANTNPHVVPGPRVFVQQVVSHKLPRCSACKWPIVVCGIMIYIAICRGLKHPGICQKMKRVGMNPGCPSPEGHHPEHES